MKKSDANILFLLLPKNYVDYLYSDFSVRQAVEKMRERRYSMIPVVEKKTGKYLYSLREGDFLYYLADNRLDFEELEKYPLSDITPSRNIRAVGVNCQIKELFQTINDQNFVPVTDDKGVFIGIVTRKAVINLLLEEKEWEKKRNFVVPLLF